MAVFAYLNINTVFNLEKKDQKENAKLNKEGADSDIN
jgi:hypothetical protein